MGVFLKRSLVFVAVVIAIAGLIEWNARRQAAAMTRELLKSPEAQAALTKTDDGRPKPCKLFEMPPGNATTATPIEIDRSPLAADERCIQGKRYRSVEGGWQETGTCPS
jgi:hypothetical protein